MRLFHFLGFPFLFFIFFALQSSAFAWNGVGHKLIALIAYQHLNADTRLKIDQLTLILDPKYPPLQRFLYGAVWADHLREQDTPSLAALHYVDYLHPAAENVVWAIEQNQQIFISMGMYSPAQKARSLRFLIHFVGDIHQPLHCMGDHGGNLFWLKTPAGKISSLHHYWDDGLGLFAQQSKIYQLNYKQLLMLAEKIQTDYPDVFFKNSSTQRDPKLWAQESFLIATHFSYNVNKYAIPSEAYLIQGRKIVEQRIALAGYRLAVLLNQGV